MRREGFEVHLDLDEMLKSLISRKARVKCFWLIREYVFNEVIERVRKFNSKVFVINDLLDLDYTKVNDEFKVTEEQIRAINNSDLTVLVSPYESRILSRMYPATKVLDVWKPFISIPRVTDFSQRSNVLFVGGFRHLPNVEGIFWFADEVYPEVKDRLNLNVQIVGTGLSKSETEHLSAAGLDILGGVESLSEVYEKARAVIVPLLSGAGMKGKLAEALSHGVPVVTTSVGAEGYDFQKNDMIEVVDSPIEFGNSLLRFANEADTFLQASKAAYIYIEKKHSEEAVKAKLDTILHEIEREV